MTRTLAAAIAGAIVLFVIAVFVVKKLLERSEARNWDRPGDGDATMYDSANAAEPIASDLAADGIDAVTDDLVAIADEETALGHARLTGEVARRSTRTPGVSRW